ncbi:MAG: hypothetical protein WBA45_17125 [Microthrixaceae bacterium]
MTLWPRSKPSSPDLRAFGCSTSTEGVVNNAGPTRLLQVLSDTGASDENLASLQLHQALTGRGWAVRTLALAPGRHSELATTIPVMAPNRRSFTAVGQFRTEQAWADVVLLRGLATAGVARAAGRTPQRVLALWSEPARWIGGARISRLESFLLRGAASVVVTSEADRVDLVLLVPDLSDLRAISVSGTVAAKPDGEPEQLAAETAIDRWMECLNAALPSRP